jgi:outer membrane immunogenic protein
MSSPAAEVCGTPAAIDRFERLETRLGGGVENSLNCLGASAPGWFMKSEYRDALLRARG